MVAPVLRHFGGKRRFSGAVVTIKCFEDNSRLKELLETEGAGRVIAVDGGGSRRYALLGDMLASKAAQNGWSGVVIHGCVRDTDVLATMDIGIMALAAMPRRSLKHGEGVVGVVIDLAGTPCKPGDRLFADEDGVVLIEQELVAAAGSGG